MKETVAYDCYRYLREGRPIFWRRNELLFFRSLMKGQPSPMLIFDIGANRGQRTAVFAGLGAKVIAVEPDGSNQALLARRFAGREQVTLVAKAVSDAQGTQTFWIHTPGSGLNSLSKKWVETLAEDKARFGRTIEFPSSVEVETITLDSLIASFGKPTYVKVDVEGHEASVLRGLSGRVPLLSFEVNLPDFIGEGLQCIEILACIDRDGRFNWSRDCQGGLALQDWLGCQEFSAALRACTESSVEVFWRSGG